MLWSIIFLKQSLTLLNLAPRILTRDGGKFGLENGVGTLYDTGGGTPPLSAFEGGDGVLKVPQSPWLLNKELICQFLIVCVAERKHSDSSHKLPTVGKVDIEENSTTLLVQFVKQLVVDFLELEVEYSGHRLTPPTMGQQFVDDTTTMGVRCWKSL
ncbi:unnamed protein product [Linum trigynum]|uniref:Uncharacterized protein n=1 Tax=Linum trigynum TaxID=586398 RepID=A0AAV2E5A7_9ROSI